MRARRYSIKNLPDGCSQERADKISQWSKKVWDMHWQEYAPVSNARSEFLHYLLRDHMELTEDLMNTIELSVQAFTTYLKEKKRAGDKLVGVQTLSVWYNQGKFEQEIITESTASLRDRQEKRICTQCSEETIGPMYSVCGKHLETKEQKHKLTSVLNSLGLYKPGQSLQELSQNCREYLQKNGAYGKVLNKMTSSLQGQEPGSHNP